MRWLAGILSAVWIGLSSAAAEERIALVVGNSDYAAVSPLDNPAHDAALIAGALEAAGFQVRALIDSPQSEMKRAIADFGQALRQAGPETTGLFYYAGHGVQSFGVNYLLPVDAQLSDAADLDLVAVSAESILRQMSSARNRTNIVILDACRNNPFAAVPELNDSGLAEMKAPRGTFLAYATAPGEVALDGTEGNSPFTKVLAEAIPRPGLPIEQLFKGVRIDVVAATGGMQTPWDASSLTSEFSFTPAAPSPRPAEMTATALWQSVAATRDPVQVMLFLRGYPDSVYRAEAEALLASLMADELQRVVPAPTALPPAQGGLPGGADPAAAERMLFDAAQGAGDLAGWERYLRAYPQGTFVEIAEEEIAALSGAGRAAAPAAAAPVAALPAPAIDPGTVSFTAPLTSGGPGIEGHSLAELISGTPLYPPIEGLPDEMWKGQSCASCHQWTEAALCDQGKAYLGPNFARGLALMHPLGPGLKQNLRAWAEGGCRQ